MKSRILKTLVGAINQYCLDKLILLNGHYDEISDRQQKFFGEIGKLADQNTNTLTIASLFSELSKLEKKAIAHLFHKPFSFGPSTKSEAAILISDLLTQLGVSDHEEVLKKIVQGKTAKYSKKWLHDSIKYITNLDMRSLDEILDHELKHFVIEKAQEQVRSADFKNMNLPQTIAALWPTLDTAKKADEFKSVLDDLMDLSPQYVKTILGELNKLYVERNKISDSKELISINVPVPSDSIFKDKDDAFNSRNTPYENYLSVISVILANKPPKNELRHRIRAQDLIHSHPQIATDIVKREEEPSIIFQKMNAALQQAVQMNLQQDDSTMAQVALEKLGEQANKISNSGLKLEAISTDIIFEEMKDDLKKINNRQEELLARPIIIGRINEYLHSGYNLYFTHDKNDGSYFSKLNLGPNKTKRKFFMALSKLIEQHGAKMECIRYALSDQHLQSLGITREMIFASWKGAENSGAAACMAEIYCQITGEKLSAERMREEFLECPAIIRINQYLGIKDISEKQRQFFEGLIQSIRNNRNKLTVAMLENALSANHLIDLDMWRDELFSNQRGDKKSEAADCIADLYCLMPDKQCNKATYKLMKAEGVFTAGQVRSLKTSPIENQYEKAKNRIDHYLKERNLKVSTRDFLTYLRSNIEKDEKTGKAFNLDNLLVYTKNSLMEWGNKSFNWLFQCDGRVDYFADLYFLATGMELNEIERSEMKGNLLSNKPFLMPHEFKTSVTINPDDDSQSDEIQLKNQRSHPRENENIRFDTRKLNQAISQIDEYLESRKRLIETDSYKIKTGFFKKLKASIEANKLFTVELLQDALSVNKLNELAQTLGIASVTRKDIFATWLDKKKNSGAACYLADLYFIATGIQLNEDQRKRIVKFGEFPPYDEKIQKDNIERSLDSNDKVNRMILEINKRLELYGGYDKQSIQKEFFMQLTKSMMEKKSFTVELFEQALSDDNLNQLAKKLKMSSISRDKLFEKHKYFGSASNNSFVEYSPVTDCLFELYLIATDKTELGEEQKKKMKEKMTEDMKDSGKFHEMANVYDASTEFHRKVIKTKEKIKIKIQNANAFFRHKQDSSEGNKDDDKRFTSMKPGYKGEEI